MATRQPIRKGSDITFQKVYCIREKYMPDMPISPFLTNQTAIHANADDLEA